MKLIVSRLEALSRYVSREFYYIQTDLITNYGWKQIDTHNLWNTEAIGWTILKQCGEFPDTILFWEGYELTSARAEEISRLACHKFVYADDLHCWNQAMRQSRVASFALCEKVLSTYGYAWERFYPEFRGIKKVEWIPHSSSRDFRVDYNQHPENAILLSGAVSHHYPLRQEIKALHDQGHYPIAYHPHPGYHCQYAYESSNVVGRGYAEMLNQYRVGFTDALTFGYVVAKFFEIPATGALLLADDSVREPLRSLGFIEDKHYLTITKENLEQRVRYVLDESNHEELDEIRRRGQELVWDRHKTSDRAKQIDEACRS